MKAQRINLSAGEFTYYDSEGEGLPILVALHGMGRDGTDWQQTAEALASHYRVLALDQRGHGQSPRTPDYSLELLCQDVDDFVETMGLTVFNLLGFSMGDLAAYLYGIAHAHRIKRLVLVDTPLPYDHEREPPPQQAPQPIAYDWDVVRQLAHQLNRRNAAWWDGLQQISCPVLLLAGGAESWMPQHLLAEAASRMPNATVVDIPGGGHALHRAQFPRFIAQLKTFLSTETFA